MPIRVQGASRDSNNHAEKKRRMRESYRTAGRTDQDLIRDAIDEYVRQHGDQVVEPTTTRPHLKRKTAAGVNAQAREKELLKVLGPFVEGIRARLFGTKHRKPGTPPCADLAAAAAWIADQVPKEPAKVNRQKFSRLMARAEKLVDAMNAEWPGGGRALVINPTRRLQYLTQADGKKRVLDSVETYRGTPLGDFHDWVWAVASVAQFSEPDIVAYVLTGRRPSLRSVNVHFRYDEFPPGAARPVISRRRVILDLDWRDVTYVHFRRVYQELRGLLGTSRKKARSEKLIWLLRRVARHGEPPSPYDRAYWERIQGEDPWEREDDAGRVLGWRAYAEMYQRHLRSMPKASHVRRGGARKG